MCGACRPAGPRSTVQHGGVGVLCCLLLTGLCCLLLAGWYLASGWGPGCCAKRWRQLQQTISRSSSGIWVCRCMSCVTPAVGHQHCSSTGEYRQHGTSLLLLPQYCVTCPTSGTGQLLSSLQWDSILLSAVSVQQARWSSWGCVCVVLYQTLGSTHHSCNCLVIIPAQLCSRRPRAFCCHRHCAVVPFTYCTRVINKLWLVCCVCRLRQHFLTAQGVQSSTGSAAEAEGQQLQQEQSQAPQQPQPQQAQQQQGLLLLVPLTLGVGRVGAEPGAALQHTLLKH